MSTYIKTLKMGDDQIAPRTYISAVTEDGSTRTLDEVLADKQAALTASTGISIDSSENISVKYDNQTLITDANGNLATAVGGYVSTDGETTIVDGNFSMLAAGDYSDWVRAFEDSYELDTTNDTFTCYVEINCILRETSEVIEIAQDCDFEKSTTEQGAYTTTIIDNDNNFTLSLYGSDYSTASLQNHARLEGVELDENSNVSVTCLIDGSEVYNPIDYRYIPIDGTTITLDSDNKLSTPAYIKPDAGIPSTDLASGVIPTKTSDLTNDSNFLTSHQDISGKQDSADNNLATTNKTIVGAINELNTGKANSADIPTTVSDLTNDSGYIADPGGDNSTNKYLKKTGDSTYTWASVSGGSGGSVDIATSFSNSSTNDEAAGALAVYNAIKLFQNIHIGTSEPTDENILIWIDTTEFGVTYTNSELTITGGSYDTATDSTGYNVIGTYTVGNDYITF